MELFGLFSGLLAILGGLCATVVPVIVMIVLGIYLYRRSKMRDATRQSAQNWSNTMGTVTMSTVQVRRSARSRSEIPVVVYQYEVNGQSYTGGTIRAGEQYFNFRVWGEARKVVERYPVGAQVMVYYNPANHAESALER